MVGGERLTLEAGEYAVVQVNDTALLRDTWTWLLGHWLATSGRREKHAPEFERFTSIYRKRVHPLDRSKSGFRSNHFQEIEPDDVDIVLAHPLVSRQHARIVREDRREGPSFIVIDLESSHGTWVNGIRIDRHAA